jgi:hypothetical protein
MKGSDPVSKSSDKKTKSSMAESSSPGHVLPKDKGTRLKKNLPMTMTFNEVFYAMTLICLGQKRYRDVEMTLRMKGSSDQELQERPRLFAVQAEQ